MKVKALVSFSGLVSMAKDEIKDIKNKGICKDLLEAGYVVEFKEKQVKADED
jgi:hypothetical protein